MAFDFSWGYDENLMQNVFFQTLQKDFSELFTKAIAENCVICVPKKDSFPRYLLVLEDFLSHILVPTEELPRSHFSNLCGAKVKITDRVITVHHAVGHQNQVRILFQETFYSDGLKYEVLCIEQPLDEGIASSISQVTTTVLNNYIDCLNLLSTESGTHETIESVDKEVKDFLKKYDNIDVIGLQEIQELVEPLYTKCLQIVLKNPNIKKKYKLQKHSLINLKFAVETYLQHGIYKEIIKTITFCTESDDSKLNKIIRNFSDLHFKDFKINSKFYSNIPKARYELSRINGYSTSLGKLGCLRRTILALSENIDEKLLLNADGLLEVLAFLIIKTNLPNWNAQVIYLKLFYHANHIIFDENSYLIASLEAAILYIQEGLFCNYNGSNAFSPDKKEKGILTQSLYKYVSEIDSPKEKTIHQFFHQVALGNLDNVKKILTSNDEDVKTFTSLNLCHPLCLCDNCLTTFKTVSDTCPTVNSCDDQGLTALHVASMYNVPSVVEYLLNCGANCNAVDSHGRTPAHYAAFRGHQNALLLLLHKGANINALDNSLNTPLHLCTNNGHENCVKALIYFSECLGAKLDVNQADVRGDTPLHHAAKWGYRDIVRILLESGSNPMILNKKKISPLDYAHNDKVLQLLKQKCQNVDYYIKVKPQSPTFDLVDQSKFKSKTHKGVQPNSAEAMKKVEKVLRAVEKGDMNLVCFYMGLEVSEFEDFEGKLKGTTDNDSNDRRKCHPLCTCSKCALSETELKPETNLTRHGQKKGLNINVCNSDGYTPLHVAAKEGHIDLVRGFIKNGASLNVQTHSKLKTPLMLACEHQNQEVAKELLKAGCNIDLQDHNYWTALHYACNTGNTKLVETLLKYEPNVNLKNRDNKTALQEAKDKVFDGIIRALTGVPKSISC